MYSAHAALSRVTSQPASNRLSATLATSLNKTLKRSRWQKVLGKIASASASDCCVLGTSELASSPPTLVPAVRVGGSPSTVEAMRACLTALRSLPAGVVTFVNGEHIAGRKREPIVPVSMVGLSLIDGKQHSVVLTACRHRPYHTKERQFFERLAPRLGRLGATLEADRFELARCKALNTVFDRLAAAVFVTDCEGRILHINAAAERVLSRGKGLSVRDGQLTTGDHASTKSLRDAIEQLCSGAKHHHRSSVVIQSCGGRQLLATVVSLTEGDRDNVLDTAGAAVFVSDADREALIPGEGFAKLYNLTACELSLLRSMLPGRCVKSAAEAEMISEATARTHLHHIFMKTGTNKQVELMQLFSSYALPVLAEPEDNLPTAQGRNG